MQVCKVCGSDKTAQFGEFKYFALQRCRECGFVTKTYGPELREQISKGRVYESGDWVSSRQVDESVRSYAAMLFRIYGPFLKSGTFFEIGPGDGWNMRIVRDAGWNVAGVESSRANCDYIKTTHGIDVVNGSFETTRLETVFDNILMSHVIEHVEEPRTFIAKSLDLLSPNGTLIIATPNLCSRWSRLWGPCWSPYLVPDHVSFFCPEHLEKLVGDRGATVYRGSYEGPANFTDSLLSAMLSLHFQERMMRKLRTDEKGSNATRQEGRMLRAAMGLPGTPFRRLSRTMKGTDLIMVLKKR